MARYIDADRLISEISGNGGVFVYGVKAVMAIVSRINAQPTADVVEVRHGEWIWTENGEADYEQFWVCSVCGEKDYIETNYCPNCGAKMDGKDINVPTTDERSDT